jgi:hypothetical protein
MDIKQAFILGFRYGQKYGFASPREAEEYLLRKYKDVLDNVLIDVFCHGADDGARGDAFRLELL